MSDAIPVSELTIHNSPNIHAWPATTTITKLVLAPTGVHLEFDKQDGPNRWPDVPFGDPKDNGSIQYTLWIVLQLADGWHAAGCIEFWHGLFENGGPVSDYATNWYYDPARWNGMAGHQPAPAEIIGFLVTSGDARHGDSGVGLHERSNVVSVPFPTAAGATFTFAPDPVPPLPPAPAPVPDPSAALIAALRSLAADVVDNTASTIELTQRLHFIIEHGIKVHL